MHAGRVLRSEGAWRTIGLRRQTCVGLSTVIVSHKCCSGKVAACVGSGKREEGSLQPAVARGGARWWSRALKRAACLRRPSRRWSSRGRRRRSRRTRSGARSRGARRGRRRRRRGRRRRRRGRRRPRVYGSPVLAQVFAPGAPGHVPAEYSSTVAGWVNVTSGWKIGAASRNEIFSLQFHSTSEYDSTPQKSLFPKYGNESAARSRRRSIFTAGRFPSPPRSLCN